MDVTLGPWTAALAEHKPLAEAMGNEAWKTVEKAAGFTPKALPIGNAAIKGYSISGRVTSVVIQGRTKEVYSTFTIWVDGTMSNVPPISGNATALGSDTAEDALRAVTEMRVTKILQTIKTGRVLKAK
jgi:hypothetical protein